MDANISNFMNTFSIADIDKLRMWEKRYESDLRHRLNLFGIRVNFAEINHHGFVSDKKRK
jgi:hypothetical protein